MILYDDKGQPKYVEVLHPNPGVWVALAMEPARLVTAWTQFDAALRADFTDLVLEGIPSTGVEVTHCLVWDGDERMHRIKLDYPMYLSRYTDQLMLIIER